mmetsp:Transcript_24883/g.78760  ORF Transcript_24883/g.78760 Transcript_24883/m.78760 type:complete len:201 (-) Transcript_24883:26-628(-)
MMHAKLQVQAVIALAGVAGLRSGRKSAGDVEILSHLGGVLIDPQDLRLRPGEELAPPPGLRDSQLLAPDLRELPRRQALGRDLHGVPLGLVVDPLELEHPQVRKNDVRHEGGVGLHGRHRRGMLDHHLPPTRHPTEAGGAVDHGAGVTRAPRAGVGAAFLRAPAHDAALQGGFIRRKEKKRTDGIRTLDLASRGSGLQPT